MASSYETQRRQLIAALWRYGVSDQRVLNTIASIPRELFLDETLQYAAYADCALPIGLGQTISQPLIVATMTEALELVGDERVLEIGTGSGYQAAILARLARHVYSVERYPALAYQAALRLARLETWNVSLFVGDGSAGWPEQAPYERIIVTAAAPAVPSTLLSQLADGGLMVIPVGSRRQQELQAIYLKGQKTEVRSLGRCTFVPLIGAGGWHNEEG